MRQICIAIVLTLASVGGCLGSDVESSGATPAGWTVAATIAPGVFDVKTCVPERMSPGFTLVWPLEGRTWYWFQECEVVRIMDIPGRTNIVRQGPALLYGIVGGSILGYNPDGTRAFAIHALKDLQGPAHHDVLKSPQGTIFTLLAVDRGGGVRDDVVVELTEEGEVLWSWSANLHLLGALDGSAGLLHEDWIHSNSLDLFPDGDVLLSARNLNEVVRIDYPSGDVVWRWGGDILGLAHNATVRPSGNILVYDNGVGRANQTGIVEFSGDGHVVRDERLDFAANAFGSVQVLDNGNWLVVDGTHGRLIEYAPDFSQVVLEIVLMRGEYIPYHPDPHPVASYLYRATRVKALPGTEEGTT